MCVTLGLNVLIGSIFVDSKFLTQCESWVGSALSSGGRVIIVNSVLSHIPSYYISMFLINKTVLKRWDKPRKRFFWHSNDKKRGTIWSNGAEFAGQKVKGGWV